MCRHIHQERKVCLSVTHHNGDEHYLLPQNKIVTIASWSALCINKMISPSHYMNFAAVRRFTESTCSCRDYLKFGSCHHAFSLQIHRRGGLVVPLQFRVNYHRTQFDTSDTEEDTPEVDESDVPDVLQDEDVEEVIVAPPTQTRLRRAAAIYNAGDF